MKAKPLVSQKSQQKPLTKRKTRVWFLSNTRRVKTRLYKILTLQM